MLPRLFAEPCLAPTTTARPTELPPSVSKTRLGSFPMLVRSLAATCAARGESACCRLRAAMIGWCQTLKSGHPLLCRLATSLGLTLRPPNHRLPRPLEGPTSLLATLSPRLWLLMRIPFLSRPLALPQSTHQACCATTTSLGTACRWVSATLGAGWYNSPSTVSLTGAITGNGAVGPRCHKLFIHIFYLYIFYAYFIFMSILYLEHIF